MANSDITIQTTGLPSAAFNPESIDLGSGRRMTKQVPAKPDGTAVNPATSDAQEAIRALLAGTLAAVLAAGEAHIGEIGSAGAHPSATPTATALTYATGKCIGGLNDLAGFLRAAGRGAMIQSATLRSKVAVAVEIDLIIFRETPADTAGLVDGATFTVAPADIGKVSKVLKFTAWDSVGTACLSTVDGIGKYMTVASGTTAKCILVARGAVTLATASDLIASLGLIQD